MGLKFIYLIDIHYSGRKPGSAQGEDPGSFAGCWRTSHHWTHYLSAFYFFYITTCMEKKLKFFTWYIVLSLKHKSLLAIHLYCKHLYPYCYPVSYSFMSDCNISPVYVVFVKTFRAELSKFCVNLVGHEDQWLWEHFSGWVLWPFWNENLRPHHNA